MPGLSGPALGGRLADLEQRWIDSDFRLDRETLLALP
jgi:poly(A) polymerase